MFELRYNDLKFMVQNCNYFFTNLIATHMYAGFIKKWKEEMKTSK